MSSPPPPLKRKAEDNKEKPTAAKRAKRKKNNNNNNNKSPEKKTDKQEFIGAFDEFIIQYCNFSGEDTWGANTPTGATMELLDKKQFVSPIMLDNFREAMSCWNEPREDENPFKSQVEVLKKYPELWRDYMDKAADAMMDPDSLNLQFAAEALLRMISSTGVLNNISLDEHGFGINDPEIIIKLLIERQKPEALTKEAWKAKEAQVNA